MSDPRDRFNLWACPRCGYQSIEGITGGVGPWPGDGQVRCPSSTCEYRTVMEYEGTLTRHLMDISQGGLSDEDALCRARELEQARADGYDAGLQRHAPRLRGLLYRWLDKCGDDQSDLRRRTFIELADLPVGTCCEACGGAGYLVDPAVSPFDISVRTTDRPTREELFNDG